MGRLSRYDTVYLGADKPDLQQIPQQIERLEQSKTELADIEKVIIEIEVGGIGIEEGRSSSSM